MSREEKEECVIRLYKENKSTREIAKLMHMSFSAIGAITKKVKLEADGERGALKEDDIKSKSKFAQAMKLYSELKSPVEVAIELDLSADQVQAMYLEYWRLGGMYRLAQIYEEEVKYDLHDLLRLHRMVKGLGMEKQDIINLLELVKHNQLQTMQTKVENLRNDIDILENEKTKAISQIFRLKRMIGESEETLVQKRKEIAYLNRESRKVQQRLIDYNPDNLSPITDRPESDTNSHSTEIVPYNKE
jgi:hypothetical protein